MLERLQGKKIAVVGLGANNQKLAQFLAQHSLAYDVIANWRHPDDLVGQLDKYDVIFRTPGLPARSLAVLQAQAAGVEISSQTKLFFELCPGPIIGITGTKGKGTTSSLLAAILTRAGKTVWLAGNIGRDPFEFFSQLQPDHLIILELSSFQLQDLEASPHLAIVLNITPDHLNYHLDFDEYIAAKAPILKFQQPADVAILHPALPQWFRDLGQGQKVTFNPTAVAEYATQLLGEHNRENIAAAAAAAKVLGVSQDLIKEAVAQFQPLPHRLNVLRTVNNLTYVDDAFSTNLEPTIAAMAAMTKPFVLVVGGSDKGLDFSELGRRIEADPNIRGLVVIGDVADKILAATASFKGGVLTGAKTMKEIIIQANSLAPDDGAVLFSPATASFGLFKNEHERAAQFVSAVEQLN